MENNIEKKVRRPGIEPGSTAWKAAMLTTIPPTPRCRFDSNVAQPPRPVDCSSVLFVLCPNHDQGNKTEGVVLNRVCILRIFCPEQGQVFKSSAAQLYPNIG